MYCLQCHYDIGHCGECGTCPECGRAFDRSAPDTFGVGKPRPAPFPTRRAAALYAGIMSVSVLGMFAYCVYESSKVTGFDPILGPNPSQLPFARHARIALIFSLIVNVPVALVLYLIMTFVASVWGGKRHRTLLRWYLDLR